MKEMSPKECDMYVFHLMRLMVHFPRRLDTQWWETLPPQAGYSVWRVALPLRLNVMMYGYIMKGKERLNMCFKDLQSIQSIF